MFILYSLLIVVFLPVLHHDALVGLAHALSCQIVHGITARRSPVATVRAVNVVCHRIRVEEAGDRLFQFRRAIVVYVGPIHALGIFVERTPVAEVRHGFLRHVGIIEEIEVEGIAAFCSLESERKEQVLVATVVDRLVKCDLQFAEDGWQGDNPGELHFP